MTTSDHSNRAKEKIERTAHLFVTGASLLLEMRSKAGAGGKVQFQDWANALCKPENNPTEHVALDEFTWLWETLRTAPQLREYFGDLPPESNRGTRTHQHFDVFGPGELFVIGMNNDEVAHLLNPARLIREPERVRVQTKELLQMRPGKGHRLECCDCRAEVTIQVHEVFSLTREADIMRIEEERVALGNGCVKVQVDSLNQAYTVSSRRLQPNRRGHGGRIYDHIVHVGNEKRTSLEKIRQEVEAREWVLPR